MKSKYWKIHKTPPISFRGTGGRYYISTLLYIARLFASNTSVSQLNYDIPKNVSLHNCKSNHNFNKLEGHIKVCRTTR